MTETQDIQEREITQKYFKRFGQIAVEKEYIKEEDLFKALKIQLEDDLNEKPHRFLSDILFQMGVMSVMEIEDTLNELFQARIE